MPKYSKLRKYYCYWNATYKDIDYNYYAEYGGISHYLLMHGGVNRSWSQWKSDGFDVHGNSGNSTDVILC